MDNRTIYKWARSFLILGAKPRDIHRYLEASGWTLRQADAFFFREKTKQSFQYIRLSQFLLSSYAFACCFLGLMAVIDFYTQLTTPIKTVNMATFALALFVVSLLFKPKPQEEKKRFYYTCLELLFPGALFALAVLLILHPGWQVPGIPQGGAFESSIWPFLWLGAWLGPKVLALVTCVVSHYIVMLIHASYFEHRYQLLLEQYQKRLRRYYRKYLLQSEWMPYDHVQTLTHKIVKQRFAEHKWQDALSIDLYQVGIQVQVHYQPLGAVEIRLNDLTYSEGEGLKAEKEAFKEILIPSYLPRTYHANFHLGEQD